MTRVVGDHADRRPSSRASAVIIADAEVAPQLEHGPGVEQQRRSPIGRRSCGGDPPGRRARKPVLVGARPRLDRALEVRQVLLGDRDRRGLVGNDDVDHAVRPLHLDRSDRRRFVNAEPSAFDHRRSAHADVRVLGGDHDVAAAEQRGVAGEAVAGVDADERHAGRTARRAAGTRGSRGRSDPAPPSRPAALRRLR